MNFLSKLNKSRQIILEMLDIRGYKTDNYSQFTIDEIDTMFRNMDSKINYNNMPLDIICNNTNNKIIVKYILHTKIRSQNLKTLLNDMIENEIVNNEDEVIIIVKDKVNNLDLDNILDSYYNNNGIFVQLFSIEKLLINITKHVLVPKLRILSKEESKEILNKFNLSDYNKLPLILKSDPQAKFCGVKSTDVVEITRPSETSGTYKSYRYCV